MSQQFVVPGDEFQAKIVPSATLTLGPNTSIVSDNTIKATTCGILNIKESNKDPIYYVEANTKRYTPQLNDFVIGTIVGAFGEYCRVSLNNFSSPVLLNQYSFPNASKKNRPHLLNGDLVYARVAAVERNVDVEIGCVDPTTGKDGGFGVLRGGYVVDVKLAYARYLLFEPEAPILKELVKRCKFEIAIGVNGKIWIKTESVKETAACTIALKESQAWAQDEIPARVEDAFSKFGL